MIVILNRIGFFYQQNSFMNFFLGIQEGCKQRLVIYEKCAKKTAFKKKKKKKIPDKNNIETFLIIQNNTLKSFYN